MIERLNSAGEIGFRLSNVQGSFENAWLDAYVRWFRFAQRGKVRYGNHGYSLCE